AAPGGQQRPQGGGVCVFRHGQAVAGHRGTSGGIGVQWIGLALAAACGPSRAADLGHLDARGLHDPGQARTVARGPFYPGDHDGAETSGPSERVVVADWARRELGVCQGFSGSVMTARWLVSRWVSARTTKRRDAATMVMSLLLVIASR